MVNLFIGKAICKNSLLSSHHAAATIEDNRIIAALAFGKDQMAWHTLCSVYISPAIHDWKRR
jgi:hypothetical protein